jgi:uncharacterized protein YkwD
VALPKSVVRGGTVLAGALLIALLSSIPAARAQDGCAGTKLEPTGDNGGQIADAVVCLLNEERASRGLKPLGDDSRLLKAARRHSSDMVRRGYFDHRSPEGDTMVDRAKAARYVPKDRGWRVAENLAWGTGAYGSARHVVASWMKSAPHRRNILDDDLRHVGVGIAGGTPRGHSGGATFTLLLGRR